MKEYRTYELKYYVISCVFVFFWFHYNSVFQINILASESFNIWDLISPILASPVFYIFTVLFDSLYGSNAKFKIIYINKSKPSAEIFSKIFESDYPPWVTKEEAIQAYPEIHNYLNDSSNSNLAIYQEREWYKIYSKYRDSKIESLDISAKEYRLHRDLNIATLNLIVIYLAYCLVSRTIFFKYILFLFIMLIITNITTKNKGKKWVYNVISYDINTSLKK